MIRLEGVSKAFGDHVVARDLDYTFPPGSSVAILGRNGAGKSTLLQMIAGTLSPDRGVIHRHGSVSWPVGFAGSFHGDLTGLQNVRFVARIYGVDSDELGDFVAEVAGLGRHLSAPVRDYSAGMRARLAFAVSMGVPFDTYLIDEVTAVGDAAFRRESEAILASRLSRSGAIVVSHALGQVQRLCDRALVLEAGSLTPFEDVDTAIAHYQSLLRDRPVLTAP